MSPLKVSQGYRWNRKISWKYYFQAEPDSILQKKYSAVFHERPARGPRRNSRGLWGQEFHGPCPYNLKVARANSPDRHRLPVG